MIENQESQSLSQQVVRKMTERLKREEELREHRQKLASQFDTNVWTLCTWLINLIDALDKRVKTLESERKTEESETSSKITTP